MRPVHSINYYLLSFVTFFVHGTLIPKTQKGILEYEKVPKINNPGFNYVIFH